jgi:hypothetical protein
MGLRHLTVVDRNFRVVGILTRRSFLKLDAAHFPLYQIVDAEAAAAEAATDTTASTKADGSGHGSRRGGDDGDDDDAALIMDPVNATDSDGSDGEDTSHLLRLRSHHRVATAASVSERFGGLFDETDEALWSPRAATRGGIGSAV